MDEVTERSNFRFSARRRRNQLARNQIVADKRPLCKQ